MREIYHEAHHCPAKHFGGGGGFENLAGGLQTVEQRHGHVHQHQRGTKLFGQGDRFMAIFRFADHFKVSFEFQNFSEFLTDDPLVVR